MKRLAEGANLPVAAGARETLDDGHRRQPVGRGRRDRGRRADGPAAVRCRYGFQNVDVGARAAADLSIEGVPLASASRVDSSSPPIKVGRMERTIRIELETSVSGPIEGIVTIDGPAGTAQVPVVGLVATEAVEQRVPPGTQIEVPATDEPAATEPEPAP